MFNLEDIIYKLRQNEKIDSILNSKAHAMAKQKVDEFMCKFGYHKWAVKKVTVSMSGKHQANLVCLICGMHNITNIMEDYADEVTEEFANNFK